MFFRGKIQILSFLLPNVQKQDVIKFKNTKVSKILGAIPKNLEKTQNSRKNSSVGRISPRLRDQVVLKIKTPASL